MPAHFEIGVDGGFPMLGGTILGPNYKHYQNWGCISGFPDFGNYHMPGVMCKFPRVFARGEATATAGLIMPAHMLLNIQ